MLKNINSLNHPVNSLIDSVLNCFLEVPIPENMDSLLDGFSSLSGCPCLFIDFKNRYVRSNNSKAITLLDSELTRNSNNLFADIQKIKSVREDESVEFVYGKHARGVFVPVKVKEVILGYFAYGQFIEKTDPLALKIEQGIQLTNEEKEDAKLLKILSREEIEANIYTSIRFVKGISSQFEMNYDLKNEIKKNQETANQLRVQKIFFENLFENSPEAIVILDNEDKVIQANQEFLRLFEYTQKEIISQKINDLIVPERYKDEGASATRDASVGQLVDMTTIRQTKTGKQIHVQVMGKPIVLDNDQLAVYGIYRNLTQQVWNQKSQKIIHHISEILNSSMNSVEMISKIGEELVQIVGAGRLFLELIAPNRRSLNSFTENDEAFKAIRYSESLSSVVIREKRMLYLNENQINDAIVSNRLSLEIIPKTWLGIPLIAEERVLGVFGVAGFVEDSEMNLESIKLLEFLSVQLATGVIKKAKDSKLRMLQRSMQQSPASIVITDLKGDIEYVNPKFCDITGYSLKEVIGKNPRILKSGITPDKTYKDLWNSVLSGDEWHGEFLNVKKNKELFWERANLSAIKDEFGTITHIVAVKEDITDAKHFEKELLESKNKAEESDRLKSAFLANMSHELRTPLNAVIGFSNLCDDSLSMTEILEFVGLINKSGNQLLGIIEDILSFTSIESEVFQISEEEFFMFNFIEDVKEISKEKRVQENKERLGLLFKKDENFSRVLVKSDYQRLLQVVTNLIKNAFKFTNEGQVEFGYKVDGEELCIYIKDSGVGINEDKKNVIFDRFRQADDSITRTFGGTGLGLAICKKIMDMLGGSIEVESEPNVGSVFTLRLNCVISKTDTKKEFNNTNGMQTSNSPLILVAEDEISNFKLIEAILKRNSYEVVRAENGEEAVEMCRKNTNICLVLMDIRMPVMDGLIATKKIKGFSPNLPIIAQTAYAMDGDENKAIEEGCDDYISKPIRKELLLEKIKALI
ncbi:PAS domain S-box protein [Labilibaculum sp. A4]|uniref:PAS domain S-box protein n=1 Tax=Labilibaculum euxinus TaxID=2686357 RepID=UPI000F61DC7B|nr:PAS domain S-box protein [Labilibaculum euxinus]MDQ1769522.1 PAS domain S-box protein [Labilibaculum euxinus]MWN75046.1 PAS domain S-box protein [Labilibaculum euxinus]